MRTVGNGDPMHEVCIYVATYNWNNPSNWGTSRERNLFQLGGLPVFDQNYSAVCAYILYTYKHSELLFYILLNIFYCFQG